MACFIASKIEETTPIDMDQILFEAGKGKFHHWKIVDTEMKILTVLEYRILSETLTDRVFTLLEQAMTT